MEELPELPFEQVLSYLNLEDRLKARAVSKRWYHKINCFKVKSLCFSERSSDFIWGKQRWVSGAFAQNFISSIPFTKFFHTYGQTILSSLKRLRLCDIDLWGDETMFARTLNSFSQLEQLDIIGDRLILQDVLNLPMLIILQIENVRGIEKLTLEAPRLREVKILDCYYLGLEIVHSESVERLVIDWLGYMEVEKLKNLQYLYLNKLPAIINSIEWIDSTFLSSMHHLKEFHTNRPENVSELFEQKQRSGRADLKIYLKGLLLNGPHDPAINVLDEAYLGELFVCLSKNPSRLADEIPFYHSLPYSVIESVAPGLVVDLLKRFTHLNVVEVSRPVQDIERFLNLIKNRKNIFGLTFECDQPQDLFDRLPEHCAVQKLILNYLPPDLGFIFRLKHLIYLKIDWSIDIETVRRAFQELPVLSYFKFRYDRLETSIGIEDPTQFRVWLDGKEKTVFDLNAAIEFITGKEE